MTVIISNSTNEWEFDRFVRINMTNCHHFPCERIFLGWVLTVFISLNNPIFPADNLYTYLFCRLEMREFVGDAMRWDFEEWEKSGRMMGQMSGIGFKREDER
jgi:hypothetical protein